MLKKFFLNKRSIPVPIPIKTLDEALQWIEKNFVPANFSITRVFLDGQDIVIDGEDSTVQTTIGRPIFLHSKSNLEIQIDSPIDLAIQTLDTIKNLADINLQIMKTFAVECWGLNAFQQPASIDTILDDLILIADLWRNYIGINPVKQIDVKIMLSIMDMFIKSTEGFEKMKSVSDWKSCAKIALNNFEPALKSILIEMERLQGEMYIEKTRHKFHRHASQETTSSYES